MMLGSRCSTFITLFVFVCVCVSCPPSTDKVPHFSRLGDVEVNAGQNASFQCVATGKVSEIEPFLLEVRASGFVYNLFLSHQANISAPGEQDGSGDCRKPKRCKG